MRKTKLILICLIFGFLKSYGQDFSKNSLFGGIGTGYSNNSIITGGLGTNWSMGYQRDIWNNRLRIVPSVSLGTYTERGPYTLPETTDFSKAHYSSKSLKVNLNFDMLKIKAFSLFIGTGLTANCSSGFIRTWSSGKNSSKHFHESNFTFNGLIGLRLNPKQKRIAYELLLLDGSFNGSSGNKNYFSEWTVLRARIIVKLK